MVDGIYFGGLRFFEKFLSFGIYYIISLHTRRFAVMMTMTTTMMMMRRRDQVGS